MTRVLAVSLLFGMSLGCTGCATLFHGSRGVSSLQSTPTGAEVWIDGSYVGRTPLAYELSTSDEHVVFFRLAGYAERAFRIRSSIGAGWVVLDVLALVFPLIVDAATGAWLHLLPIAAVLEPSAVPATAPASPPGAMPAIGPPAPVGAAAPAPLPPGVAAAP